MATNLTAEREKWDRFFGQFQEARANPLESSLAAELVALMQRTAAAPASLFEVGCGSGIASLELARSGYDVGLMDFAPEALDVAKRVFANAGHKAAFVQGDMFAPPQNAGTWDVVWNSGVLEHYSDDEMVNALNAMRRLAKRAVVVIVPNFRSLIYSLYRQQLVEEGKWEAGQEYPQLDLAPLFDRAEMNVTDRGFLGRDWTIRFLDFLPGMTEPLRVFLTRQILDGVIPAREWYLAYWVGVPKEAGYEPVETTASVATESELVRQVATLRDALATLVTAQQQHVQVRQQLEQLTLQSRMDRAEIDGIRDSTSYRLARLMARGLNEFIKGRYPGRKYFLKSLLKGETPLVPQVDSEAAAPATSSYGVFRKMAAQVLDDGGAVQHREARAAFLKLLHANKHHGWCLVAGGPGVWDQAVGSASLRAMTDAGWLVLALEQPLTKAPASLSIQPADGVERMFHLKGWPLVLEALENERCILVAGHALAGMIARRLPHALLAFDESTKMAEGFDLHDTTLTADIDMMLARAWWRGPVLTGGNANALLDAANAEPRLLAPAESLADASRETHCVTGTFFDFEGRSFYNGGAERYLVDLAASIRQQGRHPVVYQYGNFPWVRFRGDLEVRSVSRAGYSAVPVGPVACAQANKRYVRLARGRGAATIYSAFFESAPEAIQPNVGISHGISWDAPGFDRGNDVPANIHPELHRYLQGALNVDKLVSVDTNTLNWLQTVYHKRSRAASYIPNYVDRAAFHPPDDFEQRLASLDSDRPIVVLFPRRLCEARGSRIVLGMLEPLLSKHARVVVHLCGKGDAEDLAMLEPHRARWGDRLKYYWLPLEKMAESYRGADIALVPTQYSEGTSLSCLEALASGNLVIATRVGGLPDMVIDGYNGRLIDPTPEALLTALDEVLSTPDGMRLLRRRAIETAAAFDKKRWLQRWDTILRDLHTRAGHTAVEADVAIPKRVVVDLPDGTGASYFPILRGLLERGAFVFVKGLGVDRRESFGRLQFMTREDLKALEFVPDLWLVEARVVGGALEAPEGVPIMEIGLDGPAVGWKGLHPKQENLSARLDELMKK